MALPKINAKENSKVMLKVFSGLDRRDKTAQSALSDMRNMSAKAIPALTPREKRKIIADISGSATICSPEYTGGELEAFTGVYNERFYYKGVQISGMLTSGRKSIADFNGKICIFPDKKYYNYLPDSQTGNVSTALESMERTFTLNTATFHSSYNKITGEYSAYITGSSAANFPVNFSVGDSIIISGCLNAKNNVYTLKGKHDVISDDKIVSAVVKSVSQTRMDFLLYNRKGEKITFENTTETQGVRLQIAIPDMDNICVHNNRLWGTASNGEYIYASKLGDFTNFNSFQGLSEDSWYGYVATGGGFTGICSYRSAVVAFKRNCIHHIYGDSPVNFSIPKQTYGGCLDKRSIREIGGVLYYLSNDGFYAYSGGEPYCISEQLNAKYISCAAGCDGKHYIASAQKENGEYDVLVYTPEFDVWVREDDTPFDGFCTYNGSVYGTAANKMWKLDGGTESFSWCVVSKRFTYDIIEHKGISCIYVRIDMSDSAEVNVSVSFDGADFENCGVLQGGQGFSVRRVPVRFKKCDSFRIMLEGTGDAVIHDIEIESHNGGRVYE